MGDIVAAGMVTRVFRIPLSAGALLAKLHQQATVLETTYEGDFVRLVATLPAKLAASCETFLRGGSKENLLNATFFTDKIVATG